MRTKKCEQPVNSHGRANCNNYGCHFMHLTNISLSLGLYEYMKKGGLAHAQSKILTFTKKKSASLIHVLSNYLAMRHESENFTII